MPLSAVSVLLTAHADPTDSVGSMVLGVREGRSKTPRSDSNLARAAMHFLLRNSERTRCHRRERLGLVNVPKLAYGRISVWTI